LPTNAGEPGIVEKIDSRSVVGCPVGPRNGSSSALTVPPMLNVLAGQFLPVPGGSHQQTEHNDREAGGEELESQLSLRNVANQADDQSDQTRPKAQNPGRYGGRGAWNRG
jgi:hypothetical protein